MSLEFTKISGSTPYFLNSASTAEELTIALEDYMRTGAQIIFQHDGDDCILTSFEYVTGIESTIIAYFVTPKKKLLKVDTAAGFDLVITEVDLGGGGIIDVTELPTTNIDEKSIYRVSKSSTIAVYWHDGVSNSDFAEWMASTQGITFSVVSVATIEGVTLEEGIIYVDESTGFAWANVQGTTCTIGQALYQVADNSYDKGWTEDPSAETEKGIYCVRGENSVTYHACKDGTWTELVSKEYVDNAVANAIGNAIGGSY